MSSRAWGIVFTIFALVISALSGFLAYRVQTYDTAPSPRRLMEKYLTWTPSHVKYVALYQIVQIFTQNEKLINRKLRWIKVALYLLIGSIVALAAVFLYNILTN